jgi:hypothetical protein
VTYSTCCSINMSPIIVITCYFLALAQAGSQSPPGSSSSGMVDILSRHLKASKAGSALSKYSHPQFNTLPTSTMAARPQGQQRVPGIESWIMEIPPITRCWVVASVGTSLAVVSVLDDAKRDRCQHPGSHERESGSYKSASEARGPDVVDRSSSPMERD